MVKKIYPNNACCYYVSWDNIPLTAGLLIGENLIFSLIWSYEVEPVTMLMNLLMICLLSKLVQKSFRLSSCQSCCSSCDSETCIKTTFEQVYLKINNSLNSLRKFSHGPKAILLVSALLVIRWVNPSVLFVAWIIAMLSFLHPALIKFANIDLADIWDMLVHENPLENVYDSILDMIPRASSVRKSE